jgi:hypothetical protein
LRVAFWQQRGGDRQTTADEQGAEGARSSQGVEDHCQLVVGPQLIIAHEITEQGRHTIGTCTGCHGEQEQAEQ